MVKKELISNRLTLLVAAMLTAMLIACRDKQLEPVPIASTPRVNEPESSPDRHSNPNSAILEWDAVDDPVVRGYRVYYGPAKGAYLQLRGRGIDVGNVTAYTVTGLVSQRRYYFVVTAYDKWYTESEYSNEVFKDIP